MNSQQAKEFLQKDNGFGLKDLTGITGEEITKVVIKSNTYSEIIEILQKKGLTEFQIGMALSTVITIMGLNEMKKDNNTTGW